MQWCFPYQFAFSLSETIQHQNLFGIKPFLFIQLSTHLKWEKAKDGEKARDNGAAAGQQKPHNGKMDFVGVFRAVETVSCNLF